MRSNPVKKIFIIIISALIIINVIVGAFLFLDIQILKAPLIHANINPIEITPDHILLEAQIHITNPNPFDISIENFKVASTTSDGYEIGQFFIAGGNIPPNTNKTFIATDQLGFSGHDFTLIKNRITLDIGITVLGIITKTIPFEVTADVSLANITNTIQIPVLHLQATIDGIAREGILFSGTLDAYNPNPFDLIIENLSLKMQTETNVDVGTVNLTGGILKSEESLMIDFNGTLLFKALDAKQILVNLTGSAGIQAAGIKKSIPFSVDIQLIVPDPGTLLSLNDTFNFILSGDFKLRVRGILCTVDFMIYNPSNIPLDARNLICSIFRFDNNKTRLLGMQNMSPCTVEPKNEVCVSTQILIPYSKFLFSGAHQILPDWFILTIKGNFSISGINRSIPFAITGNLSPHFFMNKGTAP
jgi:LEA14-like dessication related protein